MYLKSKLIGKLLVLSSILMSTLAAFTHVSSGFKVQPVMPKTESQKPPAPTTVEKTTDLFDMLTMDDPNKNGSHSTSVEDTSWANFQSAEACVVTDEKASTSSNGHKSNSISRIEDLFEDASPGTSPLASERSTENLNAETISTTDAEGKSQSASGIDDLLKDSMSVTTPTPEKSQAVTKPQANVKDDILNLFEKSNMVSPFVAHQQQLAFLSQQQALLMASTKPGGIAPAFPGQTQQPGATNTSQTNVAFPTQNWPSFGYQIPGMSPAGLPKDADKVGSLLPPPTMIYNHHPTLSPQMTVLAAPVNEASTPDTSKPSSPAKPSTSSDPFDFSSLTNGMFSKR